MRWAQSPIRPIHFPEHVRPNPPPPRDHCTAGSLSRQSLAHLASQHHCPWVPLRRCLRALHVRWGRATRASLNLVSKSSQAIST